jgi:multidrug efflux system membrane fusion protein
MTTVALSALAAAVLVGCQPAVAPAGAAEAAATPAPPAVPVVPVIQQTMEASSTQIGRVEASQRVDVRPRVAGTIDAVLFREGELVSAGQPLIRLDPRPFDIAVARATAELKLAQARESLARSETQRAHQLALDSAIAAEEVERRQAAHAEAQARSAAAQAGLQSALLDREFAVIRAPIGGRIGRALVTAGNPVSAGAGQPALATLLSVSPLHVHFDIAEPAQIDRLLAQRSTATWQARILDASGERELARAPVDFADNEMNAATGTLRLRARIDGAPTRLVPGQYLRVQWTSAAAQPTLLVPDKAIGTDQGRRFVFVVDADGKVEYRAVTVGRVVGDQRVVSTGLVAGEQVVVAGLMRVRPGMTVSPQTLPADGAAQASAAPAAKS